MHSALGRFHIEARGEARWSVATTGVAWLLLVGAALFIAGCETTGGQRQSACEIDPSSLACACERKPGSGACACAESPDSRACFCARSPGHASCQTQASCPAGAPSELVSDALANLGDGNVDGGSLRVNCALAAEPDNRVAQSLREQLDSEPLAFLRRYRGGGETRFVIPPGATLGDVARTCLGASHRFVALARYNGIDVPSRVPAGVSLRIPGTQVCSLAPPKPGAVETPDSVPPPAPAPVPGPDLRQAALDAERGGDLESAYRLITQAADATPDENISGDRARIAGALVLELGSEAYDLEERGDVDGALARWKRVREIDPRNVEARLNIAELEASRE